MGKKKGIIALITGLGLGAYGIYKIFVKGEGNVDEALPEAYEVEGEELEAADESVE